MLIKKNSNLNLKQDKIRLKTEKTTMNHLIKKWCKNGVFKKDLVF